MKQHVFNLYPVVNQDDLRFSYRYVEVDGELGAGSDDPDFAARNLNLLAKKVAFGQELPVAIIRSGERPLLAVAADHPIKRCEYQLTPHVVSLRPHDEIHSVTFSNLDEISRQIALSFLGWELRGHLYGRKDLWRSSSNTFFRKRPVNVNEARRSFDIYGGFSPRFLFVGGLLHIAVPVIYCYTDSQWADQAFDNQAIQRLGGRKMLYHFGAQVYPVKFQKRTGKTLRAQQFCPEGTNTTANVYDWTVEKAGQVPAGRQLDPDSPAIQYRNVGNEEERYGALSLCKLMLNNDDPRVARSRREHQRNPKQLDVLDHTAAFTFFYEGGAVCAMRDQESNQKEKLSRELVAKLVYDGLKQDLPDLDEPPRSIVLRRDGRLFEAEWLGFLDVIKKFIAEGLLPGDVLTGAVEIPKHYSFGIRLAESGMNGLQNPELGAWEQLTKAEGIVCTTGLPFNIPGTVEPLFVRVVRGNLNAEWVLEDTFGMSQLCWPVPTACMRLPIDLKLCDEHLRAFAGRADDDNALFGGTLENDEEPLLVAAR